MLLGTTKMRPTLFIGLGGSGGRVVDVLARRLLAEEAWPRYADLLHFTVVDTDANDLARLSGRIEKSSIAVAHKPRRAALHRGEGLSGGEDRRVTSWVHPWYGFREVSQAGAGQIRLEARYSLHCQLAEATHHSLKHIVRRQLQRALRAQLPNRGSERVRFFIFASTAGGTGSGASLTVAALLRSLAAELGAEAEVFGTFFLPSLFRDKVAEPLVPKINANGYAALKEVERFQELRYEGGPEEMELVFDPTLAQGSEVSPVDVVRQAPFDWVYVADRPEAMAIEQIYAAAGEAAFLQLFTPILGYQDREADNFRQLQTSPAAGHFALQYGSIGASVVELPRRRLVRYSARLWTVETLLRMVVARGEGDHAVDLSDPAFKALGEDEQSRRIDAAFADFIAARARAEAEEKTPGLFTEIAAFTSRGTHLVDAFRARLRHELEAAEDAIDIDSINAAAITPESCSLNAARDHLGRDFARSRQALSTLAAAFERDIASGALFTRFFDEHGASPLLQRRFLIELDRLAREELRVGDADDAELAPWCPNPFDDPESGRYLALRAPDPAEYRVDSPEVRKAIDTQERGLLEAAKRVIKRDAAFAQRRLAAVGLFNSLRDTARDALVVEFWQRVARALELQVAQRLEVFRVVAKKGQALVDHLGEEAERCRRQGLELPDIGEAAGQTAEFHLGSEVFHDERAGRRQWDLVHRVLITPQLTVEAGAVLAIINDALREASTSKARRLGAADGVLHAIATGLDALARARVAQVYAGLDLAAGLVLEARLAAVTGEHTARAFDHGPAHARDALERVPDEAVAAYLREKIARVAAMSRPLGRFDEPVLAGTDMAPYRPRFFGVDPTQLRANPILGDALALGAGGFERLEDWTTPDLLSFYQACLGVPLYAYLEVSGPLARSYDHQIADPRRREPLHVDHRWESPGFHGAPGPGLPDLDPPRREAWEARREAAGAAAVRDFAAALAAGVIARGPTGRYAWSHRGRSGDLGGRLGDALAAFGALTDGLRGPLHQATEERLTKEPRRVAATLGDLAGLRFDAEADGKLLESQAITRIMTALEQRGPGAPLAAGGHPSP